MKSAIACITDFSDFDVDAFADLYTPLRKDALGEIKTECAKMQSAAVELAYLSAAIAAHELWPAAKNETDIGRISHDELIKRFEYSYSENGKPVLDGAFMSLSHTAGAALAVVAPFPVGADIERERRVSQRVAKRIMNASEYMEFLSLDEKEKGKHILECWTAKESFLKLTGEGISAGLSRLYYNREKAEVLRERTGERATIITLDSTLTDEDGRINEAGDSTKPQRFFICVCSENAFPLYVLHFYGAEAAAHFVRGGFDGCL